MMARIVVEAEKTMEQFPRRRSTRRLSIAEAICESIAYAAEALQMGAIAVFTETGNTARMISKYRPKAAIYAFSDLRICDRMNLFWGVHPVEREPVRSAEEMVSAATQELLRRGRIRIGDVLGVVAGTRMSSGSTNFIRLHLVTAKQTRTSKIKPQSVRPPR